MHLQRLKISEYRGNIANEDYEAEYLSRPAAAALLAGAAKLAGAAPLAPMPNPPAIKCAESKKNFTVGLLFLEKLKE
jgi:hypothetical protein